MQDAFRLDLKTFLSDRLMPYSYASCTSFSTYFGLLGLKIHELLKYFIVQFFSKPSSILAAKSLMISSADIIALRSRKSPNTFRALGSSACSTFAATASHRHYRSNVSAVL